MFHFEPINKLSILFVDRDRKRLRSLKESYKIEFTVFTASNEFEALDIMSQEKIDFVVSEHELDRVSGIVFLNKVRITWPEVITILLTCYENSQVLKAVGIHHFLLKPYKKHDLKNLLLKGELRN